MAQQITNFFSRGNRGSFNSSPVKPRSSSSSSNPASALKTISNNRNFSRDIPHASPRELIVFCDPSPNPKPRKTSDAENSDGLCSSQESTHSSGSTSGSRKIRTAKKSAQKPPSTVITRDEGVQTEEWKEAGPSTESQEAQLPKEALDLLADEPSENYYKDLAEARREALAETLEENQSLHDLNETLRGERDRLSESFHDVSATNESLRAELAKYSKLNETLEEENRLLKEALGLDNGEDDDDDGGDDENNGEWDSVSVSAYCFMNDIPTSIRRRNFLAIFDSFYMKLILAWNCYLHLPMNALRCLLYVFLLYGLP